MQKEIREIIDELQEKMLEGTFVRNANEYMEIFTTLKGIVEDPTFCNMLPPISQFFCISSVYHFTKNISFYLFQMLS